MVNISFKVDNGKAQKMVNSAINAMKDFSAPLKLSREYELNEVRKQFVTRGSNITGQRWAKRKKPVSWGILEKTGKLKGSFRQSKLTKNDLEITSPVKYFRFHQMGTRKMPKRQILGFSEKMKKGILNIFHKYLTKKIKNG